MDAPRHRAAVYCPSSSAPKARFRKLITARPAADADTDSRWARLPHLYLAPLPLRCTSSCRRGLSPLPERSPYSWSRGSLNERRSRRQRPLGRPRRHPRRRREEHWVAACRGIVFPGMPPPIISMESPMRTSPCTPVGIIARNISSAPKTCLSKLQHAPDRPRRPDTASPCGIRAEPGSRPFALTLAGHLPAFGPLRHPLHAPVHFLDRHLLFHSEHSPTNSQTDPRASHRGVRRTGPWARAPASSRPPQHVPQMHPHPGPERKSKSANRPASRR